jgi:acyl carrier protein
MSAPEPRRWTAEDVFAALKEVMIEDFELEGSEVQPASHLVDDLDLDSLDAVDLAVRAEEIFGYEFDAEDLVQLQTVQDVVDLVHRAVASPSA